MSYLYWALIALGGAGGGVLLVCLVVCGIRRRAYYKVKSMAQAQKVRELDNVLNPFGFMYIPKGDFVGSTMNNWQREMGYCWQYDEAAPAMFMMIDCEPIYFNYAGKRWLLEFWKGQYGMTTGAEIGLYVNDTAGENELPKHLFYSCAADEERLQMKFTLRKHGKVIMERSDLHWWLTGFLVGEYSKAAELTMDICICFPNMAMKKAVYKGLLRAGYASEEIIDSQCALKVHFDRPHCKQPRRCRFCSCYHRFVNWRNRRNCKIYLRATRKFRLTLDKIVYIGHCFPCLYRRVVRVGMRYNRRRLRKYGRRKCWE
ncbi:MAG: DUF4474 domain-containing protein [Clostridium sp.]|jgi:hypothetical protein|nr:DUF4474 domain-containing protein [Clostridium sp.]